jgi:hypothetical protein
MTLFWKHLLIRSAFCGVVSGMFCGHAFAVPLPLTVNVTDISGFWGT